MLAQSAMLRGGLVRRLALNAVALAAGGVIAQLCFLAVEALVARRLGRADYGVTSTVYAISFTALYFVEFGMGNKLVQDGARDPRCIPVLLGTTFALKLILAGLVYAVLLLALPALGYGAKIVDYFAIFFAYAVLFALQESLASVNSARLQMHINAAFQAATPLAVLAFVAIAMVGDVSLSGIAWSYVLACLLVSAVWTWKTFRAERPRLELARTPEIIRGSWHYGLSGLLYQMSYRVEVIALSLFGSMVEVGLFAAADRLADIAMKVSILGSRVVSPVLFRQSRHDRERYVRSCRMVVRGASILGATGGLMLAGLAEPLMVGLFGAAFAQSALALSILAPSIALRFATSGLRLVLTSSDLHGRRVGGLAVGVGAAAALNLALIPRFGIAGAALARLSGDFAQIAVLLASPDLPLPRRLLLAWMGVPIVLAAVAHGGASLLTHSPWLHLAIALPLFTALLLSTGTVRPSELRALLERRNEDTSEHEPL